MESRFSIATRLEALGLGERRLCLSHDRLKRLRLARRQVGEHLAVELDIRALQAVDELRIGQAAFARAGIDALNPERAEIALLDATVAIGIAQPFLDLLDRDAEARFRTAAIALRELQYLLVTGTPRHAALHMRHGLASEIGHVGQNEAGIALAQDHRPARMALHLLRLRDEPVPLMRDTRLDLARGGAREALLGAALGLHLGHFIL